MKTLFRVLITLIIAAGLLAPSAAAFAQDAGPGCVTTNGRTICAPDGASGDEIDAQASANFKLAYSKTLKGGYVAHGVAMRNLGYGTITVNDVPAGAKVVKAYLVWSLMAPAKMTGFYYNKGKINGSSITGSLVATAKNPAWPVATYGSVPVWSYRADVTGKMKKGGNGTYALTGFASGLKDGSDPYTITPVAPALDGATLIIIFSKSNYPNTTIKLYNGAITVNENETPNVRQAVTGMNVRNLPGLAQATFFGADGYSLSKTKPETRFFEEPLDAVTWEGKSVPDGLGVIWPMGNTWDSVTTDLTGFVEPYDNEFWFTVTAGSTPFVWEGLVVSYASGDQDSDGDKLKDSWELFGINGLNLPEMGANPLHKDLFVEADYMTGAGHDHLLDEAHLDDIVQTFSEAPVSNPDGTKGINIHIDTGGAVYGSETEVERFDLGGGNGVAEDEYLGTLTATYDYDWSEFQAIKDDDNFAWNRVGIFHYAIFAHNLAFEMGSTSGISRNGWPDKYFVKGATDFIISMGGWASMGDQDEREGTFVHELGHNLGLRHGGNDHVNYKPNYFSVMNYFYQTWGVGRDGGWHYDYSRIAPTITETKMSEAKGIPGIGEYIVRWVCPFEDPDNPGYMATGATLTGGPIDWNCNGYLDKGYKRLDVNYDGRSTTLKTQNNWANITFAGGGIIGYPSLVSSQAVESLMVTRPTGCLTSEDAQKFDKEGFYGVTP